MRHSLLLVLFIVLSVALQAQKDTINLSSNSGYKGVTPDAAVINVSIYPVPVRENFFTISCDKDISVVKVTNIIGQDIYRARYNNPQTLTKIMLDNPTRGMYLVTIIFSDGIRIVKKILVERAE